MYRGALRSLGRLGLPVPAKTDRVHDTCHAGGLERNRFGDLALDIGIDQTIQIDYVIQSLHVE
jgi:phosphotransferase system IIA component